MEREGLKKNLFPGSKIPQKNGAEKRHENKYLEHCRKRAKRGEGASNLQSKKSRRLAVATRLIHIRQK